jgi:DNA-binding transcriptional ArsR family regulator
VSPKPNQIRQLKADLFKALAHPLRLELLELLTEGERTVGALLELTSVEPSQLSKQLGVLRTAGVLTSRRDGANVFYALRDPRTFHLLVTAREILASALSDTRDLLEDMAAPEPQSPTRVRR